MTSDFRVDIPDSKSTVEVSIIDTTTSIKKIPWDVFAGPTIKGFELWNAVAYAFLITHTDGQTGQKRKLVFDLGPPKDWENDLPQSVVAGIRKWNADISIDKYVSEILVENGVELDTIEAVIWSHAHWDHIGRPSLFHPSTALLVGPGVKETQYPGFPARSDSAILAREFEGREVKELSFEGSNTKEIGSFKAIDYFGDGSFYLFQAPGHAVGHMNALARTTAQPESSFILMGADSYHHCTQLRPSRHVQLPESIVISPSHLSSCPGELFDRISPVNERNIGQIPTQYQKHFESSKGHTRTTPFQTVSVRADGGSVAIDIDEARNTISNLQDFDADERILVVAAHDNSVSGVLDFFPKSANDWRAKGWKSQARWNFLQQLIAPAEMAGQHS